MRVEPDGFKHQEANDSEKAGIHATYDNTVLLHEQIRELRQDLDALLMALGTKIPNAYELEIEP